MSKSPEIRSQVAKTSPCWKEIRDCIAIQFETLVQSIITDITKSTFQLNCHYFLLLHFICFWNKVTMANCFPKQKSNSLFVSPKNRFHIIPPLGMNERGFPHLFSKVWWKFSQQETCRSIKVPFGTKIIFLMPLRSHTREKAVGFGLKGGKWDEETSSEPGDIKPEEAKIKSICEWEVGMLK